MPHEVILDSTNGPTPRQICSELIKVAINSRQVKWGVGADPPWVFLYNFWLLQNFSKCFCVFLSHPIWRFWCILHDDRLIQHWNTHGKVKTPMLIVYSRDIGSSALASPSLISYFWLHWAVLSIMPSTWGAKKIGCWWCSRWNFSAICSLQAGIHLLHRFM